MLSPGLRCRDLISCADTIIDMSERSRSLEATLKRLDESLRSLAEDTGQKNGVSCETSAKASSYDKLFAMGSRIKYLVDSPETIYGYLDAAQFLEAAQRYVRAVEVHRSFSMDTSKSINRRFPLLRHQWPLVKKLGAESWDRAVQWLSSQGGADTQQLARSLGALTLLRPIDGADVLKHHLSARKTYILNCLSGSSIQSFREGVGEINPEALGLVFADITSLVCTTIAQCGELFSTRPGVTSGFLLLQNLRNLEDGASDIIFTTGDPKSTFGREGLDSHRQQDAVCDRISALSTAGVGLECTQWLDEMKLELKPLIEKFLDECPAGEELMVVETAVREALHEWSYAVEGENDRETLKWLDVCQWVVGRPVDLWSAIFENAVTNRAKSLVQKQFEAILDETRSVTDLVIETSLKLSVGVMGSHSFEHWSDEIDIIVNPYKVLKSTDGRTLVSSSEPSSRHDGSGMTLRNERSGKFAVSLPQTSQESVYRELRWWLPYISMLLGNVNTKLESAIRVAIDVSSKKIDSSTVEDVAMQSGHAMQRVSLPPRNLILNQFLHETCSDCINQIVLYLTSKINELRKSADGGAGEASGVSTAALFAGRFASDLADQVPLIQFLLSDPTAWTRDNLSKHVSRQSSIGVHVHTKLPIPSSSDAVLARTNAAPRLEESLSHLRDVADSAYHVWSTWASRYLSEDYVNRAASDGVFYTDASTAPPHGWEECSIDVGGEESSVLLPAHPSPAMMIFMQGSCQEIERAGGPGADAASKDFLRRDLARTVGEKVDACLEPSDALCGRMTEKGALQLIFDIFFSQGALLGSIQTNKPIERKDRQRKRIGVEASRLMKDLSSRIDPIDWASFGPKLEENVWRSLKRCRSLFGLVMSLDIQVDLESSKTDEVRSGISPIESSIVHVEKAGTRFPYLPVTMPTGTYSKRSPWDQHQEGTLVLPSSSAELLQNGISCDYSFSKMEMTRRPDQSLRAQHSGTASKRTSGAEPITENVGIGGSALEALKASTLSSLFGEKASEIGLSTLGEYASGALAGRGLTSLQLPSFRGR